MIKMKLFETWKKIMFEPIQFYEKLPTKIGYKEPTKFFLKISTITLGIVYILLFIVGLFIMTLVGFAGGSSAGDTSLPLQIASLGIGLITVLAIIAFPLILLLQLGILYVGTGIVHLFIILMGGKNEYKETFKITAYANAPNVFGFIPIINYLAMAYAIILQVIGINKKHKLSIGRSVAAVILPYAIFGVIYFVFLFVFIMAGAFV
jgi:hypothetical protein